ncbi:MAG TPA: hypothetical protein VGT98_01280 [Candidatus Elarobacter sp.]|nr:hypothetical protein [Candidatus Elarobacter sp.]HEV2737346.1 hypothetical protein [Candidatus Elarobacter sp.]
MNTIGRSSCKLVARVLALGVFGAVCAGTAGAATPTEIDGWLASTSKVVHMPAPADSTPAVAKREWVHVTGTEVSGWIDPTAVDHGFLANDQEVMLVPIQSGGSGAVFQTLLFTRTGGRLQFVGIIPSRIGHLNVALSAGEILVRIPIYKPNDANCCPSGFHYERDTLRGITLVKLGTYDIGG